MVLIASGLLQAREAFRQQRRAGQAETAGAVAGGAMLLVERGAIGSGGGKCEQREQCGNGPHGAADAEKNGWRSHASCCGSSLVESLATRGMKHSRETAPNLDPG
jgi:hypothetical protein